MFEIPSRNDIKSVTITKECVTKGQKPEITLLSKKDINKKKKDKTISVVKTKKTAAS